MIPVASIHDIRMLVQFSCLDVLLMLILLLRTRTNFAGAGCSCAYFEWFFIHAALWMFDHLFAYAWFWFICFLEPFLINLRRYVSVTGKSNSGWQRGNTTLGQFAMLLHFILVKKSFNELSLSFFPLFSLWILVSWLLANYIWAISCMS